MRLYSLIVGKKQGTAYFLKSLLLCWILFKIAFKSKQYLKFIFKFVQDLFFLALLSLIGALIGGIFITHDVMLFDND